MGLDELGSHDMLRGSHDLYLHFVRHSKTYFTLNLSVLVLNSDQSNDTSEVT